MLLWLGGACELVLFPIYGAKNSVRRSLWDRFPTRGGGQGARKSVSHLIVEDVAKALFGISEVLNERLYDKAKTL